MKDIKLTYISDSLAETYGRIILTHDGAFVAGDGDFNFVCSVCSRVMARKMGILLPFRNAVIKCNGCQSYMHLTRPARYPEVPSNLKNLKGKVEMPLNFDIGGMWKQADALSNLDAVSDAVLKPWKDHHSSIPSKIFHYTSGVGAVGIFGSGKLWASDLAYLNDASELQYAADLIEEVKNEFIQNSSPEAKELLKRSTFLTTPYALDVGYYAACFCTNGDLLSQWRAYGGVTDGYSIGFATEEFLKAGFKLRRVLYDPAAQRALLASTFSRVLSVFEEIRAGRSVEDLDRDLILAPFAEFLNKHIVEYIYCFKHPSFYEENEWRIVIDFNREDHLNFVEFRQGQGRHIPYVKFNCQGEAGLAPDLPVVSVTIGPNFTPPLAKKSMHLMIERYGYEHVEILGTDAPLRV